LHPLRALRSRIARLVLRSLRAALRRYIRGGPRSGGAGDREAPVTILLGSAWGMGGTIRTVLNLAGHLAQRHEVEILSVMRRRDVPFFELPPGVKVTALDDQRPGATPRPLRLVRRILRSRRSVLMPPATHPFGSTSLWTDVRLARALRGRSGLLIGSHPSLNLLAADLSPPGVITIGQEHMHLNAHGKRLRRAMAKQYPRLDALVVLTEQDAEEFSASVPGANVEVMPNSVRDMGGGPPALTGTTIAAAGRLTPQKGFDLLIEAFARIAPDHPDWRLRIYGGGPHKQALQQLVDEHGLADVVSLPGPAKDLGKQMEDAAVFVLSSRFEGFPLILLEAMSKGLPVVSFDCPTGPRDLIDDHRNGILVPARDVDGLARGMAELMADGDLRRRLGAAGADTATAYSVDAIGRRWEELFARLSERGRSGRRRP
jgi:glycosyltransferase involved in cell wall biosynthesis